MSEYDPDAEKSYQWSGSEYWGYKVSVTAYSNGLVVGYLPVGFPGTSRLVWKKLSSGDAATVFARIVQDAIESVRDDLSGMGFRDSVAVKEVVDV